MKKDLLVSTIGFKQNDKVVELVASAPRNLVTSFFDNSRMLVPEVVSSLDSLSKQDIINFEELQNLLEKSNNPLVFDAVRNFLELYTYQRVKVQPLESFYKIRSAVAKFGTEKDYFTNSRRLLVVSDVHKINESQPKELQFDKEYLDSQFHSYLFRF